MPDKDYMTLLDVLQQEGPGSLKVLDAVRSLGYSTQIQQLIFFLYS